MSLMSFRREGKRLTGRRATSETMDQGLCLLYLSLWNCLLNKYVFHSISAAHQLQHSHASDNFKRCGAHIRVSLRINQLFENHAGEIKRIYQLLSRRVTNTILTAEYVLCISQDIDRYIQLRTGNRVSYLKYLKPRKYILNEFSLVFLLTQKFDRRNGNMSFGWLAISHTFQSISQLMKNSEYKAKKPNRRKVAFLWGMWSVSK